MVALLSYALGARWTRPPEARGTFLLSPQGVKRAWSRVPASRRGDTVRRRYSLVNGNPYRGAEPDLPPFIIVVGATLRFEPAA